MTSKTIADNIFERVRAAEAEADLVINESQSLSLKALDGQLDEHAVKSSFIVGLRVVKDGHVGSASSEATDDGSLAYMVEQALTNARYSEEKPNEVIAQHTGSIIADSALLSPQDEATVEEKIDFIIHLEQELCNREGIRNVPYNALVDSLNQQEIFSTSGRYAHQQSRQVVSYVYPLAEEGEQTSMAPGVMHGRRFTDLNALQINDIAYNSAMALLKGKPVPTKHYDVIFDINSQHDLFSAFGMIWSAKAAQDQMNPMRNRLGETVFDTRIHIIDEPQNIEGLGYCKFDDEGFETKRTTLVENGVLMSFVHNTATAKHFGVENTAHAARGAKSPLTVGLHQLQLLPGPDSQRELTVGEYLELTQLDGLHSGTNPVSGDFSCGASGYLCKDGQRVSAVRGVTVAGNLYQMFKNIVAVGDVAHWNDSFATKMATVRFGDIAISGQ